MGELPMGASVFPVTLSVNSSRWEALTQWQTYVIAPTPYSGGASEIPVLKRILFLALHC